MTDTVASLAIYHILQYIASQTPLESGLFPLFVGLQGPQGIGKTTLARSLTAGLASAPYSLKVVTFSIDDLYLGHEALQEVGRTHPGNGLLQGRGLPGTHNVELGRSTLEALSTMGRKRRDDAEEVMRIPVYDKSLRSGAGDLLPADKWTVVEPPVDVVILEGWCFGFYPLSLETLVQRWARRQDFAMPTSVRLDDGIEDIKSINENLKRYVDAWYSYFTCFIQVSPTASAGLGIIYKWRLQQEHSMKAENGGRGMSDEQVARRVKMLENVPSPVDLTKKFPSFIDRYIPGYIFSDGPSTEAAGRDPRPWRGNGLKILVDDNRSPVIVERF